MHNPGWVKGGKNHVEIVHPGGLPFEVGAL